MVRCKRKYLIPDTVANKKLYNTPDKAVKANKRWDTAGDKELNAVADKTVDTDKK